MLISSRRRYGWLPCRAKEAAQDKIFTSPQEPCQHRTLRISTFELQATFMPVYCAPKWLLHLSTAALWHCCKRRNITIGLDFKPFSTHPARCRKWYFGKSFKKGTKKETLKVFPLLDAARSQAAPVDNIVSLLTVPLPTARVSKDAIGLFEL